MINTHDLNRGPTGARILATAFQGAADAALPRRGMTASRVPCGGDANSTGFAPGPVWTCLIPRASSRTLGRNSWDQRALRGQRPPSPATTGRPALGLRGLSVSRPNACWAGTDAIECLCCNSVQGETDA